MFGREERVVIECARANLLESRELQLRDDRSRRDWDRVIQIARTHGVTPLVAAALKDSSAVPDETVATLRRQMRDLATRNLRLMREVADLTEAFERRGIEAIPYRGPVIAAAVYGDVGRREFGDLDFLVSKSDIPAAKSVLLECGYEPRYLLETTDELSETQERVYVHAERDYPFEHARKRIQVELHWRVVSRRFPTNIRLDSVWNRRSSLHVGNTDVPVLAPEDRLLMCCVHGTRHRWERLSWLCDVAACLQTHAFDWDAIETRARNHRCERMIYLGLAMAEDVLDVALPDEISRSIARDAAIDPLRASVRKHLFDQPEYWYPDMRLYQSKTIERYRDKAAFWTAWALKPNRADVEAVSLPRPFVPLYVIVRPVRLARTAVDRLVSTDV